MAFVLSSPAFPPGGEIPAQYTCVDTCVGADITPPLAWAGTPPGTRSLVLVLVDPDAPSGEFHHWGVYDIPATRHDLAASGDAAALPAAVNDFGKPGYGGPCPPHGRAHRYDFNLLALDAPHLDEPPGAHVGDRLTAARPHVLGEARLVGTFAR